MAGASPLVVLGPVAVEVSGPPPQAGVNGGVEADGMRAGGRSPERVKVWGRSATENPGRTKWRAEVAGRVTGARRLYAVGRRRCKAGHRNGHGTAWAASGCSNLKVRVAVIFPWNRHVSRRPVEYRASMGGWAGGLG